MKKMHHLGDSLKTFLVIFAAVFGLSFVSLGSAGTVEAKELTDVITSVDLLNASDTRLTTDSEGVYQLRTSTAYKLRALFDLKNYNGNLENGDYFTFDIPAPLDLYERTQQLTDTDTGVTIAEARITKNGNGTGGTVTVTLKNLDIYLEATGGDVVKDVSGNFAASFKIDSDITKEDVTYNSAGMASAVTHTYTTTTNSGTVEGYENFAKAGGQAISEAWNSPRLASIGSVSSGNYASAWRVRVNTGGQDYGSNLVLTDTIPSSESYAAIQYIPESLAVYSAPSMTSSTSATASDFVLLTEGTDYTVQWNANYTNFTVTFADGSQKYWVTYKTTTPNDGSTVANSVSVATADGTDLTQRSNNTRTSMTASATSLYSGTIVASTAYRIKINKTDSFTLAPVTGAVYTVTAPDGSTQDITTNDNGIALTDEYDASLVGQTFTVKEKTAPAGYQTDDTEYTVTLGAAGSSINLKDNPIPATVDITATKALTGRTLADGEFTFNLYDTNGNLIGTAKNDSNGSIVFKDVEFLGIGTYNYTIKEDTGTAASGITFDENSYPVTVEVKRENNLLTAKVTSETATLTNRYEANPATITLSATKVLTGRTLTADEFEFALTGQDGAEIETVKNAADGSITFSELTFNTAGTYTYTISEESGSAAGITYDDSTVAVTVTVTDNGKGQLEAEAVYADGDQTFENTYVEPTTTTTTTTTITTTTEATTTASSSTTTESAATTERATTTNAATTTENAGTTETPAVTESTTAAQASTATENTTVTEAPTTTQAPSTEAATTVTTEAGTITTTLAVTDSTSAETPTTDPATTSTTTSTSTSTTADPSGKGSNNKNGNSNSGKGLPSTGEQAGKFLAVIGLAVLAVAGGYLFVLKRRS
ncbi:FctA domain-containing protein [Streptococcus sp. H49]|uniref:Spy0128 family protein n=1 Tax=Streptococcus huangxiaojuni TaxID=3237239 RepID=UPI0034A4A221